MAQVRKTLERYKKKDPDYYNALCYFYTDAKKAKAP